MTDPTRLERLFEFLRTCDAMKTIERSAWIHDHSRHENDAEHSWHLGLFCLLFHRELGLEVDLERVLAMVLTHDLVEILAGDVNVYDVEARRLQREREEAAAEQLFGQLPDELRDLVDGCWREFEAEETPEAKFARAMDRLQAMAQNCFAGGRAWREHGVGEADTRAVNEPSIDRCPETRPLFELILRTAREQKMWGESLS